MYVTIAGEGDSLYSLSDFGKSTPARQASVSSRKVSSSGSSSGTGGQQESGAGEAGGNKLTSQTSTESASLSAGEMPGSYYFENKLTH